MHHFNTCHWSEPGTIKPREHCSTCEKIEHELELERDRIADNLYLVISNPQDAVPLALWIRDGAHDGFTVRD